MAKIKKATIKFQKSKLKGTIERRKKHNKLKQQVARRKDSRSHGKTPPADAKEKVQSAEHEEEAPPASEVNSEEYFGVFVLDSEEPLDLSDDEEHDLDALDRFDAVEEEDDVDMEDKDEVEDDSSEEEEEEEEDDSDDESVDASSAEEDNNDDSQVVTGDMLAEWSEQAGKKSPQALKHLLLAFRAVARSDEMDATYAYRVDSSKVYRKLVRRTLTAVFPILSQHIITSKKVRHPAKTRDWPKLHKVVQLYLHSCIRLLRDLEDDGLIQLILTELEPCMFYFGCFPKAAREFLRVLLGRWSDIMLSSEARAQCYQAIRHLATVAVTVDKKNYLPLALKGVYLVLAKLTTKINAINLPAIQQMLEEAGDLYGVDPKLSIQHANVYVHQLQQRQRQAEKKVDEDGYKAIYTWQYVSCIDFWVQAIAATCNPSAGESSPMQAVVQPVIDIALHTLKFHPTAQFLPLRIHLLRALISLIDATGYFIPLAPYLFEIFGNDVFKSRTESSDLDPFDWELHLKTPKAYMHTKVYQDAVYQALYDGIVDYYACFGLSIAFPELAIPAISKLKEQQSKMKGTRFVKSLRTLIEKLETHKNYIEQKRAPIEYTPDKLDDALAFLRNTDFEQTPFGNFLKKKNART